MTSTSVNPFYRHKLPHYQPENAVFFLTYMLKGTIPVHVLQHWKATYQLAQAELELEKLNDQDRKRLKNALAENNLKRLEVYMDKETKGPHYLKQPQLAQIVVDSLLFCQQRKDFKIVAFCVMSNHVHLIIHQVKRKLCDIMHDHKRFTARKINVELRRTGPFWESETFDHVIRNKCRFLQKLRYIMENPVLPGIVQHWQDYPFNYIHPDYYHYMEE